MRMILLRAMLGVLLLTTASTAGEPSASLLKRESSALNKVAAELHRLARFCIANQAIVKARTVLRTGLEFIPGAAKLPTSQTSLSNPAGIGAAVASSLIYLKT